MMRSAASSGAMRGEQSGRLGVGAAADELDLVLGVELLEDVGLELAVGPDRLDDLLALLVRRRLDQVGDLGRVQPGQLPVGDAQPGGGHVGHEGLDARPVDDRSRLDRAAGACPAAAGAGPAGCCGSTPTTSQVPSTLASSISLARMRRPPTRLIRWRAERSWASSSSPGRRSNRRRSTRLPSKRTCPGSKRDLADRDEQVASADRDDQPDHRRVRRLAQPHDEVLHAAEPVAVAVDEGALDDAREVEHLDAGVGQPCLDVHRPHRSVGRSHPRCSTVGWLGRGRALRLLGVRLVADLSERQWDPGDDDVGTLAQLGCERQVDLVVQQPVAEVLGDDHRDQHDDLPVVLCAELVDEPEDGLHHRGVVGVQDP